MGVKLISVSKLVSQHFMFAGVFFSRKKVKFVLKGLEILVIHLWCLVLRDSLFGTNYFVDNGQWTTDNYFVRQNLLKHST